MEGVRAKKGQGRGAALTRQLFLTQSVENLYGSGSEGPPHSVEDCEEGECLWGLGLGRQEVAGL